MKANALVLVAILAACASARSVQAANPTLGAHNLAYYELSNASSSSLSISTLPMNTQISGSTILTLVARGQLSAFTSGTIPTDNKGNGTATQLGTTHDYSPLWPTSGAALYAWTAPTGGTGNIVTAPMLGHDEITLSVVEVKNGGKIQDCQWNKAISPGANTSLSVTTTGPATLVAFWLGDDGGTTVTATPNNGFNVIDSQLISSDAVEAVVATKDVSFAGTYDVTWNETPTQGAQMWLVAVQNTPEPSCVALLVLGVAGLLHRNRRPETRGKDAN